MLRKFLVPLFIAFTLVLASLVTAPATAQPPVPTPVDIEPVNPTPTPNPRGGKVVPPAGGVGAPKLALPPTLDDLLRLYPDLQPYLEKAADLNIGDPQQLAELYSKVAQIYAGSGAAGVAAFLKDSGILDKLGIPLSYLDLLPAYDQGGAAAVEALAQERALVNSKREIVGYLVLEAEAYLNDVKASVAKLGASAYKYLPDTEELEVGIPLDLLAQYQTPGSLLGYFALLANLPHVEGLRGPTVKTETGLPLEAVRTSIGAQTIGADKWHEAGITGKGVKLGILDSGFGGIKELLGSELPEEVNTNVDLDEMDAQKNSHGTAVALVAHGIAPEAELYLAVFDYNSISSYIDAVKWLYENEVQIINHSGSTLVGPRDGTSPDSMFVSKFIAEWGGLWVNSAGNYATGHSLFEYVPGENGIHQFNDETTVMPFKALSRTVTLVMNWNGNWQGKEANEYIFVVYNEDGDEVVSAAEPRRGKKNHYPFQVAVFETEPGEIYYLLVAKTRGDESQAVIDIIMRGTVLADWARVPAYSLGQPGDADAVLTVGATGLEDDDLEEYSSQGPTRDERMKPDIVGPTGEPLPGYEKGFYGTSGSAPLVAGAAALVLQAFPDLSGPELKAFLVRNVVDLGDEGADTVFGAGRIALPDPETLDPDKPTPPRGKGGKGGITAGTPTATITDVTTRFNVKVEGQKGILTTVSFDLENFKGKQLAVLALFFDGEGNALEPADEDYAFKVGEDTVTVGTGLLIKVKASQTGFEDVPLFIPNTAFGELEKGMELSYLVAILDFTNPKKPQLLTKTEPTLLRVK